MKHHPSCGTTAMEDCDCANLPPQMPRPSPMLVGCLKRCTAAEDENAKLRGLITELLDTELGEFAEGAGSMAPVEDIIGRMADAVRPNAVAQAKTRRSEAEAGFSPAATCSAGGEK